MKYLIQFQLNIFALLVLIVLYVIVVKKTEIQSYSKTLLRLSIIVSGIAIIIEPLTWIFDGKQFFGSYFLEYFTNFMLLLIGPFIGAIMLSYVDYKTNKDLSRLKKRWYYLHFTIITFIILTINIFYPMYFNVTQDTHTYVSGDFLWLQYILVFIMYVYMSLFVFRNRKIIQNYMINIFLIFLMLPILGMLVQLININLFFSWSSIALSILVIYVFLETTNGERDYLTNLYTRLSYEKYVNHLIETKKTFGVVLLDLDKYKLINDKYGHQKGDLILIKFSNFLVKIFHPNKMVARLAGDEFMIVIEEDIKPEEYVNSLRSSISDSDDLVFNQISFSFGFQKYNEKISLDELYGIVDKKMYLNK